MKKITALLLACLLCLTAGCARKEEEKAPQPTPTVQIALAAYQYEQGYSLAEGWMYDMTLSAQQQIDELTRLADAADFYMTEEDFLQGHGYLLTWRNADGAQTRELLLLTDGRASMNGMIYEAHGAQPLMQWLEALELENQTVTD